MREQGANFVNVTELFGFVERKQWAGRILFFDRLQLV